MKPQLNSFSDYYVVEDLHIAKHLLRGLLKDGVYELPTLVCTSPLVAKISAKASANIWH